MKINLIFKKYQPHFSKKHPKKPNKNSLNFLGNCNKLSDDLTIFDDLVCQIRPIHLHFCVTITPAILHFYFLSSAVHPMTPPDALLPYLNAKGSLTALLEAKAKRPLGVKIIREGYSPLNHHQKTHLNLPLHRPALAWVREVLLFGKDGDDADAWVHAKSVFPISSLLGDAKRLRHLKRTPIGYVMFNKNPSLPHKRYFICEAGLCGRVTVYDWHTRPILIQEVFLDAFVQSLSEQ